MASQLDLLRQDYEELLAERGPEAPLLAHLRAQIASAERRKEGSKAENPCVTRKGPSTQSW